jgi:hypothetical protein
MSALSEPQGPASGPAGPRSHAFGSVRKIFAVAVLTAVILTLLVLAVSAGTVKWVSDCYTSHAGQHVRWTFPNGCEVEYGETYLTVGT